MHCSVGCAEHHSEINQYYSIIVDKLSSASAACIPSIPPNSLKCYWNEELKRLKQISIDRHHLWRLVGSPRNSGPINTARLKAKIEYKLAIKQAAANYERSNADEINSYLNDRNTKDFWKCWNSKYRKCNANPSVVAGLSDSKIIANEFKKHYSNTYVNSYHDTDAV